MRASITSLGLLVLVAPGPAAHAAAATADASATESAETQEFSIPAQPVSQALREYAQQSGDQVVFYSEVGKGLESTAVQGRLTRQAALQRLLLNTGLKSERVNSKTVAISAPAPLKQESQPGASTTVPLQPRQASERPVAEAVPRTQSVALAEQ